MTKSKSGMVIKVITHLLTDILPLLVIKSVFSLLPPGRYLLPVTTGNRYQSTGSSRKFFVTTTSRNITIVRCRMSLVTILVMDFVMIHWIRWIQRKLFRKNSIKLYSVSENYGNRLFNISALCSNYLYYTKYFLFKIQPFTGLEPITSWLWIHCPCHYVTEFLAVVKNFRDFIRRSDSNQSSDDIVILVFLDFKFCETKVANLKHAFGGELIFLTNWRFRFR